MLWFAAPDSQISIEKRGVEVQKAGQDVKERDAGSSD